MTRFKTGQLTKSVFAVIINDLECIKPSKRDKDGLYFYNLLIGNLEDIFGYYIEYDDMGEEVIVKGRRKL